MVNKVVVGGGVILKERKEAGVKLGSERKRLGWTSRSKTRDQWADRRALGVGAPKHCDRPHRPHRIKAALPPPAVNGEMRR